MSDESQAALTVSFKGDEGYDAPLVVVRADTPGDLLQRLSALGPSGILAKVTEVAGELRGVYAAAKGLGGTQIHTQPEPAQPVQNNPWSAANPPGPVDAQYAQPMPQTFPQQGGVPSVTSLPPQAGQMFTKQDRYGNEFVYNDPAAPLSPRGPMVKATRKKRAGGTYTMWLDPAHKACPLWKEQGNPPVDPGQLAPDAWVN